MRIDSFRVMHFLVILLTHHSEIRGEFETNITMNMNYSYPNTIYYIQSNEIQVNIDEIYCIFYIITSENIKFYIFTPPEFHITFLDYL